MQKFYLFFSGIWGKKGVILSPLLAFASGLLIVPALPPFNWWPFAFLGLSLFYLVLNHATSARCAALLGWCFGFGYFTGGLWWIANALLVEGNPYAWAYPLAVAGLPALLALFPAAAAFIIKKLDFGKTLHSYLTFAVVFAVAEWLRGHLFTGLPWNLFGYVWSDYLSMIQITAFTGPYFLTFMTLLWAALPGFLFTWKGRPSGKVLLAAVAAITMALNLALGHHRLETHETDNTPDTFVRIVQPNINQAEKWQPEARARNLLKHLTLSEPEAGEKADIADGVLLIVWPETAITQRLLESEAASEAIRTTLRHHSRQAYLITGLLRSEIDISSDRRKNRYFNSLAVYDKNLRQVAAYDKSHLVPFGEYIPLQEVLGLVPIVNMSGFTPGDGPQTLSFGEVSPVSPLVCYEIIFPANVTDKRNQPSWIVNVTNDAWYGDSPGPYQHFAQARFRAIEQGLPVVRAAGTGISGVFDPYGRIIARIALGERGAATIPLPQKAENQTLYSLYGDIFFLSITIVCLIFLIIKRCHNFIRGC